MHKNTIFENEINQKFNILLRKIEKIIGYVHFIKIMIDTYKKCIKTIKIKIIYRMSIIQKKKNSSYFKKNKHFLYKIVND